MKNHNAYILRTDDGKCLNPNFVMGETPEIQFVDKEALHSMPLEEYIKYLHPTREDAEYNYAWYLRACEKLEIKAKKLVIDQIQITIVDRMR